MGSASRSKYKPKKRSRAQKDAFATHLAPRHHFRSVLPVPRYSLRSSTRKALPESAPTSSVPSPIATSPPSTASKSAAAPRSSQKQTKCSSPVPISSASYAALKRRITQLERELAVSEASATEAKRKVKLFRESSQRRGSALAESIDNCKSLELTCDELGKKNKELTAILLAERDSWKARESYLQRRVEFWRRKAESVRKRAHRLSRRDRQRGHDAAKRAWVRSRRRQGIVPEPVRRLIRTLVGLGLAISSVGEVIDACARHFKPPGSPPDAKISARTVGRIILEGGIAARIQLAHELKEAGAFTISGDGTTNRNQNFESRHVAIRKFFDLPNGQRQAVTTTRVVGIQSSEDHTSECQVQGWKDEFTDLAAISNSAPPLRQPLSNPSPRRPITYAMLLGGMKGMMSDHASDQKKGSRLMLDEKHKTVIESMGLHQFETMDPEHREAWSSTITAAAVRDAGGEANWNQLSPDDRKKRAEAAFCDGVCVLGEQQYSMLPDDERRALELWIWVGCGMHKELNTVKGANAEMMSEWSRLGLDAPMLFFNRDNDAAAHLDDAGAPTAAADRATSVTERGGVKLCKLAGAAFNHSDDKKGHHDSYLYWFRVWYQRDVRFPDTSNTRYGTYTAAARELFVRRHGYIRYLEVHRASKQDGSLNHMESNIYTGLHDIPTITELAALALFDEAWCSDYMEMIRGAGDQNMLDMGPFHEAAAAHLEDIASNPSLVLGPSADPKTGRLNGCETWRHPEVFETLENERASLPHLEVIFTALVRGAASTFRRFISEFDDDGAIAGLTDEEIESIYLPTTNDANEGLLGTWRIFVRKYPRLTEHRFNAIVMVRRNGTEDWMEQFLGPEHYSFIRRAARAQDQMKLQETKNAAHAEAKDKRAADNTLRREATQQKKDDRMEKLGKKDWIDRLEDVAQLSGEQIVEQVQKHRLLTPPDPVFRLNKRNTPGFVAFSKLDVEGKRAYLAGLVTRYNENKSETAMEIDIGAPPS